MLALELKQTFYKKNQIKLLSAKLIVVLGRSNVGKSSFINSIAKKKQLARTSKTAGKTISINCYWCNQGFYLIDFPGYGYAKVSKKKEKELQDICEYFLEKQQINKAIILIDARRGILNIDTQIMHYLISLQIPYSIILTKIDKLKKGEQQKILQLVLTNDVHKNILFRGVLLHSSLKKIGITSVIREIMKD